MTASADADLLDDAGGPVENTVIADDWSVERASATPRGDAATSTAPPRATTSTAATGPTAPLPPALLGLAGSQAWLQAAITGRVTDVDVLQHAEAVLVASARQSAEQRLGIYRHAYVARLIGCLVDDYPSVQHLLGVEGFAQVARQYIEAHPSTHPNLNGFGRWFAAWVAGPGASAVVDLGVDAGLVADLARLEWALVEVMHAASSPLPSLEVLASLSAEEQAQVRLTPSSTLRFLEFHWPVNRYLQAVRTEQPATIPERGWSATAVYRHDWRLWRMDFTAPMAGVLRRLLAGDTLGTALAVLHDGSDDGVDDAAVAGDITAWFRAWLSSGFFSAVVVADRA